MSARQSADRDGPRTLSIGEVLSLLKKDFPDVTISKIRFLESEGLVTPARTSSGYRRFGDEDVRRLRDILRLQRDQYMPLKIIRKQLDEPAQRTATSGSGLRAKDFRPGAGRLRLTRAELAEEAEIDESYVDDLEEVGVIWVTAAGHYDEDALAICQVASRLWEFGFDARHMRSFRVVADRETGLIEQMVMPFTRASNYERDSGVRAQEAVREIASLFVQLHAAVLRADLIRTGKV